MTTKIGVNPEILIWARTCLNLSVEQVAKRTKQPVDKIINWETGDDSPTYKQLEALAYKIYKRPLAIFFFPEPPYEEPLNETFRTFPSQKINDLSPSLLFLLRKAKVMQINLAELYDNINPSKNNILKDLILEPGNDKYQMAESIRKYLDIKLETQFQWKDSRVAFIEWRKLLEEHGIFVFKEAFRDDDISGFCLYDESFPIIYVNNSTSINRQIFTLFHELCHLILKTSGIVTKVDDYIDLLPDEHKKIEILCNEFAAEFLVPDKDFNDRIKDIAIIDENSISDLANLYSVSREVILRKFLDRKIIDQSYYNNKVKEWSSRKRPKKEGGDFYKIRQSYLGKRYIELAFSKYYQNAISIEQLADYMNIKVEHVGKMEEFLLK